MLAFKLVAEVMLLVLRIIDLVLQILQQWPMWG